MQRMSIYSEFDEPRIDSEPSATDMCSSTGSIRPYDVSEAEGACSSAFSSVVNSLDDIQRSLENRLDDLAGEWGTKFIALNGVSLGIVNVDKFHEHYTKLKNAVEDVKSKCEKVCGIINSDTANINSTLDVYEQHYKNYLADLERIKNAEDNCADLMVQYVDRSESDIAGQWIVK